MHCKNCFAPLTEEDAYCKVCGKPVEKEEKSSYPSNEEIIASYKEESEPLIPSEDTIKEISEIKPVQTLEPKPVEIEQTPSDPFVVNMEEKEEKKEEVRQAPAPIINKEGISKKVFIVGIIIAIVATALIVALICIPITSSKVEQAKKDKEKEIVTKTEKENRVLLSGYSFKIPEGYSYKLSGSQLLIQNDSTNAAVSIQVGDISYQTLKSDLTKLKTNLTQAKWTVGKLESLTIENRVYLTVQAAANKKNVMIAYTGAKENQTLAVVYIDPTKTTYPDEKILKEFNPIISSLEVVNNTFTSQVGSYATNKMFFQTTTQTKTTTQKTN